MKISVLINNYNYGAYLDYCLASVANQTLQAHEIIVYDDGSTDNSLEVIERWKSGVTVLAEPNFGKHPGVNQGNAIYQAFLCSTGDIICLLDSDDAFLHNKLAEVAKQFERHPDAVMVQHPFREIDAHGRYTGVIRPRLKKVDPMSYICRTHNVLGLFTQTSGLSFRRNYLEVVLPLRQDQLETVWPDVRLSRHAIINGPIITIHKPLSEYRVHGKNDSDKLNDNEYVTRHLRQQYEYFNSIGEAFGVPRIDLEKSLVCPGCGINQPGLSFVTRVLLLLSSNELFTEKLRIVANWIIRQLKRRLSLENSI